MGGKKGKKVKSTQSKKGKTAEGKDGTIKPPSPLQEEEKGDQENISSQGDLPVVETTTTDLHLDEQTETKIVDIKNNNPTPPIKSQSEKAQPSDVEPTKTPEAPRIFSSPGLDRRKSRSNLEISSPPSEKKDPTVVDYQDLVNYNNNFAQKMGQDQEDEARTSKILVPVKHPLQRSWTLW